MGRLPPGVSKSARNSALIHGGRIKGKVLAHLWTRFVGRAFSGGAFPGGAFPGGANRIRTKNIEKNTEKGALSGRALPVSSADCARKRARL